MKLQLCLVPTHHQVYQEQQLSQAVAQSFDLRHVFGVLYKALGEAVHAVHPVVVVAVLAECTHVLIT